jgi:hypothetical protein
MNVPNQFQSASEDQLNTLDTRLLSQVGASSKLVNRTHRVVRERAQVLKARRSRLRSVMVPLVLCSALLILTVAAVWTGLYQYQYAADAYQGAADALQDVSSTIAAADDEFMVILFWFVPVTMAVLGTVWVTRSQSGTASGIGR